MTGTDCRIRPNPVVAKLRPYSPQRLALPTDLVLDANEALVPDPDLGDRFGGLPVNRYPSTATLQARLAERHGVDPVRVIVTAGADDALERALRVVCAPGRRAVLTTPSFAMLPRYARLAGAEVVEIPWWRDAYPVDAVLEASSVDTAAIAVVSPNNPTGSAISRADLLRIAQARSEALILLDHAYAEFAEEDLTDIGLSLPNVVVFRTFSKMWGAAGLRVGYAVGHPKVVGWMRSVGQPYAVSAPSVAAIDALLDGTADRASQRVARVRGERERISALLIDLGVEVLPSEGNFVLCRPTDALDLHRRLASLGIGVRRFPGHPELAAWLRITVPGEAGVFDRLTAALKAALAPEALLFDMDGVLADVSRSYRRAIVETASSFGVEICHDDVADAKARGDATNDWRLTLGLIRDRGVEADLEEVTRRFESLYQGGDGREGLHRTETARFDPEALRRMAEKRPLAVVTGRPRADAERFLADHGLSGVFAAVVCMEDAPSKPDPTPVRLALERLGVATAWMVGDTPDDLAAARGAGVLPVGLPAPGDDGDVLEQAGAAFVLTVPEELEERLP
jgi:histidinol-phosphate aminotransferase